MTSEQRRFALTKANTVRLAHAQLRAEIASSGRFGARIAAEHIKAADTSMTFGRLVCAIHQIGDTIMRRMLGNAGISPIEHVDSQHVAPRRRQTLVGELVAYAFAGEHRKRRGEV